MRFHDWHQKASSQQVGAAGLGYRPQYTAPKRGKADLLQRYHQWIYSCSSRNANAVAQAKLRLYAVTRNGDAKVRAPNCEVTAKTIKGLERVGDVVEVTSHPFIDLMASINPVSDPYETMELTQLHQELCGDAYWHIEFNNLGLPSSIQVLRPDLVRIVPNSDGTVKGYLYGIRPNQVALQPEEVIHFKFPSPIDHYYGFSPLEAILSSDEQYQRTLEYETALAQNSAIPALGVQYDGTLVGDEIPKIEADWNRALRGTSRSGKVKVFDGRFDIKEFGLAPKELGYLEGRKWTREEIAGAYGVPLSFLTTGDVNLANAQVGERTYARWTLVPRLSRIEDRLNVVLQQWYGEDRIFLAFDNPVPDDNEFELRRATTLAGANIITRDEARQIQGFDPVGGEAGSSYIAASPKSSDEKSVKSHSFKSAMEHEYVIRDSSNFERLVRVNDDFGRGIACIYGVKSNDDGERRFLQQINFSTDIWTYKASGKWVDDHGYDYLESHMATDPLAKSLKSLTEHEYVLMSPHSFARFERVEEHEPGIISIFGYTKGDEPRKFLQQINFETSRWTYETSGKWIADHGYVYLEVHRATDPLAKNHGDQ